MNAARILPDLQCSLLCEEVRQEMGGSFILIGVINYLRVPKVPVTAMKLCVFNRWTAGVGQFLESIRFIAPDQTTVLHKNEMKFELKTTSRNSTNLTVFAPVEFKTDGVYYIEVSVDDVLKLRYPIVLILSPPPGQAPPQPPPPAPPS
jgi:hypothetical protein